ncbi:hypothetical protein B0H99_103388 [Planomicrobium soli]|uniref:Uncharacterized protein n=1 Tax=Planomicrobium soli TaxID=1176648 RepID=A0A2P8H4U9_9BACL|nr:hypothetical protein B0H99_103388 [Planomicrobium soli]
MVSIAEGFLQVLVVAVLLADMDDPGQLCMLKEKYECSEENMRFQGEICTFRKKYARSDENMHVQNSSHL